MLASLVRCRSKKSCAPTGSQCVSMCSQILWTLCTIVWRWKSQSRFCVCLHTYAARMQHFAEWWLQAIVGCFVSGLECMWRHCLIWNGAGTLTVSVSTVAVAMGWSRRQHGIFGYFAQIANAEHLWVSRTGWSNVSGYQRLILNRTHWCLLHKELALHRVAPTRWLP